MRSHAFRLGFVCIVVALAMAGFPTQRIAASGLLDRGRYLVGPAGQCADCHGANLAGAPMFAGPPGVPWASRSSNLRGLLMFRTDSAAIAFLHTARLPNGAHARGPMPQYHFDVADASAIVAYLRSLR